MPEIPAILNFNAVLNWSGVIARIAAVCILAVAGVKIGDSLIEKLVLKPSKLPKLRMADQRARTLAGLLKSTVRYVVGIIATLMVLDLLGIDTRALLGGAAILGLAVGFGAQNLVRDVITGFFIIYERQFDVGDYVTIAGVSGIVEELGLRTTRLRDYSGEVHIVPNGLIEKTTNKSRAGSAALIEITIPYEEDVRSVIDLLQKSCDQMAQENHNIVEGPRVLGIVRLDDAGVVLNVWARTKPLQHWEVERQLRLKLKETLDSARIPIPYPHVVVEEKGTKIENRGVQ